MDQKLLEEVVIAVLKLQEQVKELTRVHRQMVRNQRLQMKLLRRMIRNEKQDEDWWKRGEAPPWT